MNFPLQGPPRLVVLVVARGSLGRRLEEREKEGAGREERWEEKTEKWSAWIQEKKGKRNQDLAERLHCEWEARRYFFEVFFLDFLQKGNLPSEVRFSARARQA